MRHIFISYRREETADITGRIYDRFVTLLGKDHVFKDVDSIPPGADFRRVLGKALETCGVFVVVIGPDWLEIRDSAGTPRLRNPDDFLRVEIETALSRRLPLLPVLVGGAIMPAAQALPDGMRDLAFRQACLVRPDPDFHGDVDRLIRAVRGMLDARDEAPGRSVWELPGNLFSQSGAGVSESQSSRRCMQRRLKAMVALFMAVWVLLTAHIVRLHISSAGKDAPDQMSANEIQTNFHTGWILIGYYDAAERRFIEGPFADIIERRSRENRLWDVPKIGDVLRMRVPRNLVIAQYRELGGTHELTSPPWVKEILDEGDYTGVILDAGTVVVVRDVEVSGRSNRPKTVWCRVARAEQPLESNIP